MVGSCYLMGSGVSQCYEEAAIWFRKASAQGNGDASYQLGGMFEDGLGVVQDRSEASKFYGLAAAQGCEQAFEDLRRLGST